jgi:hypothetical protein
VTRSSTAPALLTPASYATPYEHPAYLRASAAHEGSELTELHAGARLVLLRQASGLLQTVYGYPQPLDGDVEELASCLCTSGAPLRLGLSPLGAGAALAELLRARMPIASERAICVTDLDGDPLDAFDRRARRATRTAMKRGGRVEVGRISDWFGAFYRAAMHQLGAHPLYHFADSYFAELGAMPHYQVSAYDAHGLAAAALFLHQGDTAYYHLGGRRDTPAPVLGAMNLALYEGMCEAARRGARLVVLGGGRGHEQDDALLVFKRQMSTRELARPTFVSEGS